jgi:hypothetical protein
VTVGVVVLAQHGGRTAPAAVVPLPAPPAPAFRIPTPSPLARQGGLSRWATVTTSVVARERPSPAARAVARVATRTPEGSDDIVLLVGRARVVAGRLWVRVRLPVLPNNTTGWVPRAALGGYHVVRTHLVVSLDRLTATLFSDGRRVFRAPVGVGRERWPTPRGSFYVRVRVTSLRSPFYGPVAFGTSARSQVLTDWPGGGFVGIHGTDRPDLIPGRVSHGCIRLRNGDILRLAAEMPVGTPVTID